METQTQGDAVTSSHKPITALQAMRQLGVATRDSAPKLSTKSNYRKSSRQTFDREFPVDAKERNTLTGDLPAHGWELSASVLGS
jgi:hypothetical protein